MCTFSYTYIFMFKMQLCQTELVKEPKTSVDEWNFIWLRGVWDMHGGQRFKKKKGMAY